MEKMPVFVKVEEYKEVLKLLSDIKSKVDDVNSTLQSLEELKEKEDSEIDDWKSNLEDIENKIHYIDHTLFEPENI